MASAVQPPVCVEDFNIGGIQFRRVFTAEEKAILVDIIIRVLHDFTEAVTSSAYAWDRCQKELPDLIAALDKHFASDDFHEKDFFLRLSSLSPKDAYFVLRRNRFFKMREPGMPVVDDDNEEDACSMEELEDELQCLRVSSTKQCLLLLTHSYRVFIDLEYDTIPNGNALLLLPWRGGKFWYASETRVFVKDGRVQAMTEYYTDLVKGYANVPSLQDRAAVMTFCQSIVTFVETLVKRGTILPTTVADIALLKVDNTKPNSVDSVSFTLIECNAYDDTVDTCLFTDFDDMLKSEPIECRWRDINGVTQSETFESTFTAQPF